MKLNLKINPKHFNPVYKPLFNINKRFVVLAGGASSGKSHFVGQRQILRQLHNKHRNFLVLRQTGRTNRTSTFALLKKVIHSFQLTKYFEINKSEMTITNKLFGNQTIFAGLDDVEKIKSTTFETGNLTDIWFEEASEGDAETFEQLNLRLRGISPVPFQIIMTLNPISKKNWVYERFFKEADPRAFTMKTTYLDNKFRGIDVDRDMEILKKKLPEYYMVYGLGDWGEPVEGFIFKRQFYSTFTAIPPDARGVVYCDPNLSKKGKGDTTAVIKLLFSPSTQKFYISDAVCRTFSGSNDLLNVIINMRKDKRVKQIGFDGHVSQESQWSQHVENYSKINGLAFPIIDYKRYKVDELSKNAQIAWNDCDFLFPEDFEYTDDGERFLSQLYTFVGKKNTKGKDKDDAPDALVCAQEFAYESGMATMNSVLANTYKSLM